MPKVSKLQEKFSGGEISRSAQGKVTEPHYDISMDGITNYIPIIQGPMIRRPGTKYVSYAKNHTQMPALIPFHFSNQINYMMEFGDKYIRFYTNEGQVITTSNSFTVTGTFNPTKFVGGMRFTGARSVPSPGNAELITSSSLLAAGSILELPTWYSISDVQALKVSQKNDTVYITHPAYPTSKLIRKGINQWDLSQILLQDGPYLPLNSYLAIADSASINLTFGFINDSSLVSVQTSPSVKINNIVATGGNTTSINLQGISPYSIGDNIFITGVDGLPLINNITDPVFNITNSLASQTSYTILKSSGSTIIIPGFFSGSYTGSTGTVYPALFQMVQGSSQSWWADIQTGSTNIVGQTSGNGLRTMALIDGNGIRRWGQIVEVTNAATANVSMQPGQILNSGATIAFWQVGVYNNLSGFPSASCLHQDRLALAGAPGAPQELDMSMTSTYEAFSASGSNLQVNANNALQFNLTSQDQNAIKWVKSSAQGLFAGSQSGEWVVSPSTQNPSLTPTTVSAIQAAYFGSYDADALAVNNSILYIQRAQKKVRELLYAWQIQNFRSTNISELAEGVVLPGATKLVNQKEPHPTIWCLKSDGQMASIAYSRDDLTFETRAGWARHKLGGQANAGGDAPVVGSFGVMPSGGGSYDQLWLAVQRYISGSNVVCIEYMNQHFDDLTPQEFSYHFDCGVTYNSSIVVATITPGPRTMVVSFNHGLTNSSQVKFYNAVGLTITSTDANGVVNSSNPVNEKVFTITSSTVNSFLIKDAYDNYINTNSCSVYVGSAIIRPLVSSINGLGWLAGETVSILADGAIQGNSSVTSAGVLNLPQPAAVVSIGYQYNSDGQMLRTKDGSAQGSSIGSTRRCNRVAFMLHNVGELSFGPSFTNMIPAELNSPAVIAADTAPPLFDGIYRDGLEGTYSFTDTVCFRQNSGLPGMVQAIVRFFEEFDV